MPQSTPTEAKYEKLPCGRRGPHGLSRDEVAADQRRRLHGAMVEAVADRGYAAVTVNDLVALAGVSKKTLYKHFGSKQSCFLATHDLLVRERTERIAAVYRKAPKEDDDWTAGLCGVVEALLEQVATQPQRAWLTLVEALLAERWALQRIECGESVLAAAIERGLARAPEQIVLPPILIRGIVHGIWHVARERLLEARPESLPGTGPELLEWMLSYRAAGANRLGDGRKHGSSRAGSSSGRRSALNGDRACASGGIEDERTRLLHAAAQITAEGGYEALTSAQIAERAGVQAGRFGELFAGSVQECLMSYLELASARALARALGEAKNAPDWTAAVYRAIDFFLSYLVEDTAFARVAFVEIFTTGRAGLARRGALMRGFSELLLRRVPSSLRPSPLVAEAITGAVWGIIHHEIVYGRARQLQARSPQIAYLVLAPLTGGDAAAHRVLELAGGHQLQSP